MERSAYTLLAQLNEVKDKLPPIHLWHPEVVTESHMRISADGEWFHEGKKIERRRLARLFASILRREADGQYFLVTPVERSRVDVDDAAFVGVLLDAQGVGQSQQLTLTTSMADVVRISADHPLEFRGKGDERIPYVLVRNNLDARLSRSVYYQLVDLACSHLMDGVSWFGVWSAGAFFPMIEEADLDAAVDP